MADTVEALKGQVASLQKQVKAVTGRAQKRYQEMVLANRQAESLEKHVRELDFQLRNQIVKTANATEALNQANKQLEGVNGELATLKSQFEEVAEQKRAAFEILGETEQAKAAAVEQEKAKARAEVEKNAEGQRIMYNAELRKLQQDKAAFEQAQQQVHENTAMLSKHARDAKNETVSVKKERDAEKAKTADKEKEVTKLQNEIWYLKNQLQTRPHQSPARGVRTLGPPMPTQKPVTPNRDARRHQFINQVSPSYQVSPSRVYQTDPSNRPPPLANILSTAPIQATPRHQLQGIMNSRQQELANPIVRKALHNVQAQQPSSGIGLDLDIDEGLNLDLGPLDIPPVISTQSDDQMRTTTHLQQPTQPVNPSKSNRPINNTPMQGLQNMSPARKQQLEGQHTRQPSMNGGLPRPNLGPGSNRINQEELVRVSPEEQQRKVKEWARKNSLSSEQTEQLAAQVSRQASMNSRLPPPNFGHGARQSSPIKRRQSPRKHPQVLTNGNQFGNTFGNSAQQQPQLQRAPQQMTQQPQYGNTFGGQFGGSFQPTSQQQQHRQLSQQMAQNQDFGNHLGIHFGNNNQQTNMRPSSQGPSPKKRRADSAPDGEPKSKAPKVNLKLNQPRPDQAMITPRDTPAMTQSPAPEPTSDFPRVVACLNCHFNWWEKTCDNGEPCNNCNNQVKSMTNCIRPRCENFATGECKKGNKCKRAHEDDNYDHTANFTKKLSRHGKKSDATQSPSELAALSQGSGV